MAIGSVTNTAGATPAADTNTSQQKTAIDKEAFLKLLVAQLQHQDPLQPTEGTEFVAQLSQFAMVEQSIAQSSKLDVISNQVTGLASNGAVGLVGKQVTIRGNGIAWDGLSATAANLNLEAPADKVSVQIVDASGKTVRTLELGARGAGPLSVAWDGKDDVGQPAPKGSYSLKASATAKDGSPVLTSQDVTGTVQTVTYDKGYPELHLDSGATAPVSDLVGVGGNVR